MAKEQHVELVVVVNGQPLPLEVNVSETLRELVTIALERSGNSGQPAENWELRDAEGHVLNLDRSVGEFNFKEGTKLFLSLKAGVGGANLVFSIH
jgi:uncharacterized protein DUF2604